MELLDAIKARRSIRRYHPDRDVADEQVKKILEAAIFAPSSGNTQCWRFYVVRDRELRTQLATSAGHQPFLLDVPVIIVVCANLKDSSAYGERGIGTFSLQDTAAAIQNMLLTITDLGLASCWVGAFNEEAAAKVLGLSSELRPVAMLPVGYAAKYPPSIPKRKPVEEVAVWR